MDISNDSPFSTNRVSVDIKGDNGEKNNIRCPNSVLDQYLTP